MDAHYGSVQFSGLLQSDSSRAEDHTLPSSPSSRDQLPASDYLRDRLQERKAQSRRESNRPDLGSRTFSSRSDMSNTERFVQSSPPMPTTDREGTKHDRRASGYGSRVIRKDMGARETEEHISKLTNQNFDLKLELAQRRKREEILEQKIERLEALERENLQLKRFKEGLVAEIALRTEAIKEAVVMICDLEQKNEELDRAARYNGSSQRQSEVGSNIPGSSNSTDLLPLLQTTSRAPKTPNIPVVRHQSSDHTSASHPRSDPPSDQAKSRTPRTPQRKPSFLHDNSPSSISLRKLYTNDDGKPSMISLSRPRSLFSLEGDGQDPDVFSLRSPALSVLSERDFESVYGSPHDEGAGPQEGDGLQRHSSVSRQEMLSPRSDASCARVMSWMDGKVESSKPRSPSGNSASRPRDSRGRTLDQFSSMAELVQKPSKDVMVERSRPVAEGAMLAYMSRPQVKKQVRAQPPPSFGGPIFNNATLPPTPDTMPSALARDSSSVDQTKIPKRNILDSNLGAKDFGGSPADNIGFSGFGDGPARPFRTTIISSGGSATLNPSFDSRATEHRPSILNRAKTTPILTQDWPGEANDSAIAQSDHQRHEAVGIAPNSNLDPETHIHERSRPEIVDSGVRSDRGSIPIKSSTTKETRLESRSPGLFGRTSREGIPGEESQSQASPSRPSPADKSFRRHSAVLTMTPLSTGTPSRLPKPTTSRPSTSSSMTNTSRRNGRVFDDSTTSGSEERLLTPVSNTLGNNSSGTSYEDMSARLSRPILGRGEGREGGPLSSHPQRPKVSFENRLSFSEENRHSGNDKGATGTGEHREGNRGKFKTMGRSASLRMTGWMRRRDSLR